MKLIYTFINWGKHKGKFAIEVWPEDGGVMPDGTWDDEAWEDSKSWIEPKEGADLRIALKEAMRGLRIVAKECGGLEFMTCNDITDPSRLPG